MGDYATVIEHFKTERDDARAKLADTTTQLTAANAQVASLTLQVPDAADVAAKNDGLADIVSENPPAPVDPAAPPVQS